MADVVGTLSKSHIGSLLQQTTGTGSAYDDYTVYSSTDSSARNSTTARPTTASDSHPK